MPLDNSKKRRASSQGGRATKKVNIQRLNKTEETNNKSKGSNTPGKDVKSPVKRKHKDQKTFTEQEEVKGKKRAVPVTETLDKEETNSEEDEAGELYEDENEDVVNVNEVDGKEGAVNIKDPNGMFPQTFSPISLHDYLG